MPKNLLQTLLTPIAYITHPVQITSENLNPNPSFSLKQWLWAFLPPLLWAGLIFMLSAQSSLQSLDSSTLDFLFKKIAHMTVYGVLFLLLHRAFRLSLPAHLYQKYPALHWALPIFVAFLYAVSDEFHQSFVPGRYATTRDIGYDMLGVMIALLRQYRYI